MRIRMTVDMSGTRNGQPWPARGAVVELPDDEAAGYCASGMAVPVDGRDADVETATPPADEETRTTPAATAVTTANGPVVRGRAKR